MSCAARGSGGGRTVSDVGTGMRARRSPTPSPLRAVTAGRGLAPASRGDRWLKSAATDASAGVAPAGEGGAVETTAASSTATPESSAECALEMRRTV